MPCLMPDEDKNFGASLLLDFRKWWRHVKTIYTPQEGRMSLTSQIDPPEVMSWTSGRSIL